MDLSVKPDVLDQLEPLEGRKVGQRGGVANEIKVGHLERVDREEGRLHFRESQRFGDDKIRRYKAHSDRGIFELSPVLETALEPGRYVITGDKVRRATSGRVDKAPVVWDFEEQDRAEAAHAERSARARTVDEQKRSSRRTADYERWAANPRRLDFPGVDTPPR